MPSQRLKYALSAAAGFALGLTAAGICRRPGPISGPPRIEVSRGVITGPPGQELRPISVRVGDDLRQLGRPHSQETSTVVVYLTVNGEPAQIALDVLPPDVGR